MQHFKVDVWATRNNVDEFMGVNYVASTTLQPVDTKVVIEALRAVADHIERTEEKEDSLIVKCGEVKGVRV